MDWHGLIHSICEGNPDPRLVAEPALELVVGNTTFVLEHDADNEVVRCLGVISQLRRPSETSAYGMLQTLKANMELHTSRMGSIAYDSLEQEVVWRKKWHLARLHETELKETMQHIDALKEDLERHFAPPQSRLASQDGMDGLMADILPG